MLSYYYTLRNIANIALFVSEYYRKSPSLQCLRIYAPTLKHKHVRVKSRNSLWYTNSSLQIIFYLLQCGFSVAIARCRRWNCSKTANSIVLIRLGK